MKYLFTLIPMFLSFVVILLIVWFLTVADDGRQDYQQKERLGITRDWHRGLGNVAYRWGWRREEMRFTNARLRKVRAQAREERRQEIVRIRAERAALRSAPDEL